MHVLRCRVCDLVVLQAHIVAVSLLSQMFVQLPSAEADIENDVSAIEALTVIEIYLCDT